MKLVVGTKNPAKVHAVQEVFIRERLTIVSIAASSLVANQPFSDEETMQGAINRAKESLRMTPDADLAIGLEGGVTETSAGLMLCNWGALAHHSGKIWVASGAKIHLPNDVIVRLRNGEELGDIMARMTENEQLHKKEGAIGIFTAGQLTRKTMFQHIVMLLKGQYQYQLKTNRLKH